MKYLGPNFRKRGRHSLENVKFLQKNYIIIACLVIFYGHLIDLNVLCPAWQSELAQT